MKKFIIKRQNNYSRPFANIRATECCGLYELYDIQRPPVQSLVGAYQDMSKDFEMVIFHDAVRYGRGKKLCDFIRRHKLGKVTASKIVFNPNSDNNIQMWTWYVNWPALETFMQTRVTIISPTNQKQKPFRETEDDDDGSDDDY